MIDYDLLASDDIINYINNSIQSNRLSHSYIIAGESGMGKGDYASYFAKLLQCETKNTHCEECISCKQANSNNHPDIIWLKSNNKSIPVDQIRDKVNNEILIKPYYSKYKIYIIEDGDKMLESAQNALLKTIEEPPKYAVIIILAQNVNKLLQTIISRCIILNLSPRNKSFIKNYLIKRYEVHYDLAQSASLYAAGNIGRGIKFIIDEEFINIKNETTKFLKDIKKYNVKEIIHYLKEISKNKDKIDEYLDIISLWYRDILMYKATKNDDLIIFIDEIDYIEDNAESLSYEALDDIILYLEKTNERIKYNINFDYNLELMLLNLKEKING